MAYRLPAEWEKHSATILCWPSNKSDWPGKFIPVYWAYTEIIRKLAESEPVILIVKDKKQKEFAAKLLAKCYIDMNLIKFHIFETDRNWMRDSCPAFVKDSKTKELIAIDFHFDAWSKYSNFKKDEKLPKFMGKKLDIPIVDAVHNNYKVVLEGGAIDVNGKGTLITTEECLLDQIQQVRNPGFSKDDYLLLFNKYLGINNIIWLAAGIAGDDTHGHIDDIARFVNENTILACREKNHKEDNYSILEENFERLQSSVLPNGGKPEVVSIPMPAPLFYDGLRLPASYANFYIANSLVLVPTFNDENDRIALGIIAEQFPKRKVYGIHAVDLVWGLGTLHCLSSELPD